MSTPDVWTIAMRYEHDDPPETIAARRLLKALLRSYGFRALAITRTPAEPASTTDDAEAGDGPIVRLGPAEDRQEAA